MTCAPAPIDEDARARADAFVVPRAASSTRVVVALSGGVDSAVVAWLLKEAGHDVVCVSLRLAPDDPSTLHVRQGRCCSVDDLTDARRVADRIGAPFYAVDARDRFQEAVFDPFVEAYRRGETPIPCLACNHVVKFGDLHRTASDLDARLATGHYARRVERRGRPALARPADLSRDQTYYLYGTRADVVEDLLLPLGDLDKPLVRALAARAGLPVSQKPDSQEICFVPDGDHARVVEKASGPLPGGDLVHIGGAKLRAHDGVHRFTVGQRRGLAVAAGERMYVVDVDGETGRVTVGPREALACTTVRTAPVAAMIPLHEWPREIAVQVRARHRAQPARWRVLDDGGLEIAFLQPVHAVALGQAAVCYDGDVVLGGGLLAARVDGAFPRATASG